MAWTPATFKTAFETYCKTEPDDENLAFLKAGGDLIARMINRDLEDADLGTDQAPEGARLAVFSAGLFYRNSRDFQRPGLKEAFEQSLVPLLGDLIDLSRNIPTE